MLLLVDHEEEDTMTTSKRPLIRTSQLALALAAFGSALGERCHRHRGPSRGSFSVVGG